jgi:shikimate dehydrogenase
MDKKILFGILGEKLDHSLSPLMFNHYFASLNLDICYESLSVTPKKLHQFFKEIHVSDIIGLNVTIPYKERVIPYLDELSWDARNIGAVNVIWNSGRRLEGFNTDYLGFLRTLKEYEAYELENAVVLGAGGAARSIIYALSKMNFKNIIFFSRDKKKIIRVLKNFPFIPQLKGRLWQEEDIGKEMSQADTVINTTPVGMGSLKTESPVDFDFSLKEKCLAYDLIYNPKVTEFLKKAQNKGAVIENGIRMLVYQALESLIIWKGEEIDETLFIKSSEEVLNVTLSERR